MEILINNLIRKEHQPSRRRYNDGNTPEKVANFENANIQKTPLLIITQNTWKLMSNCVGQ